MLDVFTGNFEQVLHFAQVSLLLTLRCLLHRPYKVASVLF